MTETLKIDGINQLARYRRITDFGGFRMVENFYAAPMLGNHKPRGGRRSKTKKPVELVNDRKAVRELENKIMANFKANDWYLTLTYQDNPADRAEAARHLRNFHGRAKTICKRAGIEYKYLAATEQGKRKQRWHHHMIVPGGITYEQLEQLWPLGSIFARRLWREADNKKPTDRLNCHGLAEYFVGISTGKREAARAEGVRQYSFSRNCVEPVVTYERITARTWLHNPRDTELWETDRATVIEYEDSYGLKHQRYIQVRKE